MDERGHKSVILTTTDGLVGGLNGGVAITGFRRVNLKHRPQAGPIVNDGCIQQLCELRYLIFNLCLRTIIGATAISHL